MVKSALAGAVTGAFFSAVVLGSASLIAPQPAGNTPPAPPLQEPPRTGSPAIGAVPEAASGAAAPVAAEGGVPPLGAATPETARGIETAPAPQPGVSDAPQAVMPQAGAAPDLPGATDSVLPAPQTREPSLPMAERDLSISTDPVQPVLPETDDAFIVLPGALPDQPVVPGFAPGQRPAPIAQPGAAAGGVALSEALGQSRPPVDGASGSPSGTSEPARPQVAAVLPEGGGAQDAGDAPEAAPALPGAEAVQVSGDAPTAPEATAALPDTEGGQVSGDAPTVAVSTPALPGAEAVRDSGDAPTAPEAAPALPDTEGGQISGDAPAAPEATPALPDTEAVQGSGDAPTVAEVAPVLPDIEAVQDSGDAPTAPEAAPALPDTEGGQISGDAPTAPEAAPALPDTEGVRDSSDAPAVPEAASAVPGPEGTQSPAGAAASDAAPVPSRPVVRSAPSSAPLEPVSPLPLAGEPAPGAQDETETVPAHLAYAATFAPDPDLPMLAVVLIDEGISGLGPEVVSALPLPVSVSVSPLSGDATYRMDLYRGYDFEVLAQGEFPAGATAQDVAVMAEAAFSVLPRTIGMLALDPDALSRSGGEALASALARDGRALVVPDQGLNALGRSAEGAGLPVALIYRDLDADGQDARTMRRFLDQAAFQARNTGAVVVVARLRAETISALDLWSLADRAQSVQIVPVSVVLNDGP